MWWPFRKKIHKPITKTITKFDPIDDDELFYEWARGPGMTYPSHTKMVSRIEGAVPEPMRMWNDGWDKAFYEWVKDRKTKHFHCAVCGKLADTRDELSCDRCVPYPAPPIPEHLRGPKS